MHFWPAEPRLGSVFQRDRGANVRRVPHSNQQGGIQISREQICASYTPLTRLTGYYTSNPFHSIQLVACITQMDAPLQQTTYSDIWAASRGPQNEDGNG